MKDASLKGPLPGDVLREARRSRNMSLQYIARELRLDMNTVEALENDDYRNLPAPIFVKGYIRGYASLLGLDAMPLLDLFEKLTSAEEEEPSLVANVNTPRTTRPAEPNLPLKSLSYMGVTVLVVLALVVFNNSGFKKSRDSLLEGNTPQVASKAKRQKTSSSDYAVSSIPGKKKTKLAAKTGVIGQIEKKVSKPDFDTLSIKFNKDSFIEVIDANNQPLLSHMGRRGFRDKVRGKAPFRVKISKPESVEVTINGKRFNHLNATKVSGDSSAAIVVKTIEN